MKIKAKFKGADGSMGYRNGVNYALSFDTVFARPPYQTKKQEFILVKSINPTAGGDPVFYESLKGFLNNWQVF